MCDLLNSTVDYRFTQGYHLVGCTESWGGNSDNIQYTAVMRLTHTHAHNDYLSFRLFSTKVFISIKCAGWKEKVKIHKIYDICCMRINVTRNVIRGVCGCLLFNLFIVRAG